MPIAPTLRSNILALAEVYARASQIKLNTLSGYCHGDPKFLDKLKAGKGSVSGRKYDSVMEWFFSNWPSGTAFPALAKIVIKAAK